ncbi:MAG: SMP-30/gluconolactonase/LRE family protein [Gammaproteobacteria bacterium]
MLSTERIRYLATVVAAAMIVAADGTSTVFAQSASGASASDCGDEQGLTYICGFVVPEDVVNVGSTGLVLASGHRAPGNMYLIDSETGMHTELIHSSAFRSRHDMDAFPGCPGPLNLEAFDVHGISVAETSTRRFSLYTTSHGEREAIEIYDLDLSEAEPVLTWTGCVLLQQDGYFNAVIRLSDGGFVATRMRDANVSNDDVEPGEITGRLFEWHPGGTLQPLAGTELSLPNGIDVSTDDRYLYVAASGTQELVVFDRDAMPLSKRTATLPMRADNVHWDGNGMLLIAGRNPVDPSSCDGGACPSGWTAVEVDPETLAFTRLGGADGNATMQRASAAIRVGDEIWVGSNQDRIARFSLN